MPDHLTADATGGVVRAGTAVADQPHARRPPKSSGVEMAQFVALRAATCIGADYSNFALLDRTDRRTIRLFHGNFLDASIAHRYVEFDIDTHFPIAVAVRSGQVVALSGRGDYADRFPDMWADTSAAGFAATVSLPLIRVDGTAIGALGFAWAVAPSFDLNLDKALRALGELCAEIIERAETYEAEHDLIGELHLRLLSELPTMDGLTTAARYLPAGASSSVGGDWYEGVLLEDGRLALIVGDVVGHGLSAAADMALIRGLITSLLDDGVPVADVFDRLTRVLVRRGERILASAALVVIDRSRSTLTYATAGHPPPLLIDPSGTVKLLDAANGAWLGVAASRYEPVVLPFAAGAQVVMYTDGLVERRDRTFDAGIAEMIGLLSSSHSLDEPDNLIDLILETLIGDRTPADDIAVLVVKNNASN